jgi:hypothetical protein
MIAQIDEMGPAPSMDTGRRKAPTVATARINAGPDDVFYEQFYPYFAELSALTEIRKKPGFGIRLHSGMGGHALLYLSGVRLDRQAGHPTLKLCGADEPPANHGVGISVNANYKNANWVAAEGYDFVYSGALQRGERVTPAVHERTQERAKAMGLLDGVEFHDHLFRNKPPGMPERDFMYEISIANDYAVRFGRDIYRARVPLDRVRMASIVDYFNALNAPYRGGHKVFSWHVINNNCSHVTHNALAAAHICAPWPTGKFIPIAAFNFPVPKNEFVDLMRRTNDLPIDDADAVYRDKFARQALLEADVLPSAPGGLAIVQPAIPHNDVYDTENLRLIFYGNPFWGPYPRRFARILREPRYFDLRANLNYFAAAYERVRKNIRRGPRHGDMRFFADYERYICRETERVRAQLAGLDQSVAVPVEAFS